MRRWLNGILRTASKEDANSTIYPEELTSIEADNENKTYFADAAITDPSQDRFSRFPFAQRVANTIISRRESESIVIGIYGSWGDGKTTVLNFIRTELSASSKIISITFNPWRYKDENDLLRGFYLEIADALNRSIFSKKEKGGELLRKFTSFGSFIPGDAGEFFEKLRDAGTTLSTVELEELKNRLYTILKEEGKRVVVLMDDIDRLENTEIQAVFRLIKLSADAPYTVYILGFDEEMVASALEARYSSGRREAGRNFIEKIVQVPLHLPRATPMALRDFCIEAINEALKDAEIDLSEDQAASFLRYFNEGLFIKLRTPRIAKRYGNALVFSLPLLKEEVNYVDLMLIEGIRIFYPRLYDFIRDNPDLLLGRRYVNQVSSQNAQNIALTTLNEWTQGFTSDERESVTTLLKFLFPQFGKMLQDNKAEFVSLDDTNPRWTQQQRIASERYFDRYFSYTVIKGDISDLEIDTFLSDIDSITPEEASFRIDDFIKLGGLDTLIFKLQLRKQKVNTAAKRNMALTIARIFDLSPDREGSLQFSSPFSQATLLTTELIASIPEDLERFEAAKQIALEAQDILFIAGWFRWIYKINEDQDSPFSNEQVSEIGRIISTRIAHFSEDYSIIDKYQAHFPFLLWIWSTYDSKISTTKYLSAEINSDTNKLSIILLAYFGESLVFGSTAKDNYNSLSNVINTDVIYNFILSIYEDNIIMNTSLAESKQMNTVSTDEQVARIFIDIYRSISDEQNKN